MITEDNISRFFDKMAVKRDESIEASITVNYEQLVRQRNILALVELKSGDRVLDLGCGNGRDISVLGCKYPSISVTGADLSPEMLRQASSRIINQGLKNVELKVADACSLPFEDGSFDVVICSEVIEHIPKYWLAVDEIRRVLRRGGIMVLTTPNWRSLYGLDRRIVEWERARRGEKPWDHVFDSWKTPAEVICMLENHGFSFTKQVGICYLPGFILLGRLPRAIQHIIVYFTGLVEPVLSTAIPGFGYMVGFCARKN